MHRALSVVVLIAGFALSATATAAVMPFTAQYSAKYRGVPANAVMVLAPRGQQWALSLSVQNIAAAADQATLFTESRGLLMPLGGSDTTRYLGQRKSVPARFDWKAMQASWKTGSTWSWEMTARLWTLCIFTTIMERSGERCRFWDTEATG